MSKQKEIRVRGANKLADDINNIAENLGISTAAFLRPRLREIANSFPDEMKRPPIKD